MSLNCLVYVSLANQEMSDNHLQAMLKKAREKNEKLSITGMLLYRDGFFMQALEGELNDIEDLFKTISQDPRHRDLLLIYKKPIQQRGFPDWTMGFNKISDESVEAIDGYTNFLKNPTPEFFNQKASEAEAVLDQFKHQLFF
ncbi:MAG: BLUF domain-containing protein [Methylococcaceae bacterium]|nr:BLUF domain-containing protein [Methylococcaceae bacterium]MDZ4156918.1 BLUF domain-containing protein [Methylococcales bacterium]MDP2394034.1 BLUF domain-containing protein [Methylococcaceae bacterium]MDP3018502.1 BLUF domain-containing protein [Methylococcaceae bacterium]MDP3390972.1 BLUF domain-containing protein [Methylococcaceae bacterium]